MNISNLNKKTKNKKALTNASSGEIKNSTQKIGEKIRRNLNSI